MTARTPSRYRADLALVAICFIWGSMFVVVKDALSHVSTLLFLALRFTVAAGVLAFTVRRHKIKFGETKPTWAGGILMGCFLFLGFVLQTVGLRYTTASKSAFLTGLSIILVPVFAAIFGRRLPARAEVLGVGLATIGMALLTLRFDTLQIDRGDLFTIGCAASFAVHILLIGHFAPRFNVQALTFIQIATAAVLAASTFWWVEIPAIVWTPGLVVAILITGVFATAVAFSVQLWAQQYTTASRTALIFAMEPVFAALTSFVVAGEVLSGRAAAGAGLILAGILTVEFARAH